jgi:hypothetical protein
VDSNDLQAVRFERIPTSLVVRQGVCVLAGFDEARGGIETLWMDTLDGTPAWSVEQLLRSAHIQAERDVRKLWIAFDEGQRQKRERGE